MMAGAGAAAAAAAARRRREEEEEQMTPYSREELENDWEFKIIRSQTGDFRNRATLQKLMEEEARAGWQLVEKFDNSRVRFKRPRSARQRDGQLPSGVDPYRVHYGISEIAFVAVILVAVFGAVGLIALTAYMFGNGSP
jgi:hypothetical protein